MTHYRIKWCPKGCGKTCRVVQRHPTTQWGCDECGGIFSKEKMRKVNTMRD